MLLFPESKALKELQSQPWLPPRVREGLKIYVHLKEPYAKERLLDVIGKEIDRWKVEYEVFSYDLDYDQDKFYTWVLEQIDLRNMVDDDSHKLRNLRTDLIKKGDVLLIMSMGVACGLLGLAVVLLNK